MKTVAATLVLLLAPAPAFAHSPRPDLPAAPHGGTLERSTKGYVELVATQDGELRVYLLDRKLAVRDVTGATGVVKVGIKGYKDVPLEPSGDHLRGAGTEISTARFPAIVDVIHGDGKKESVRVEVGADSDGH